MIPLLGAMPPESIFPFSTISAGSVSATGTTTITLPTWVQSLGKYTFWLRVVGGWGAADEPGTVELLDASGTAVFHLQEYPYHDPSGIPYSDPTAGYLSADEWTGTAGATHITGWSQWINGTDGAFGNGGTTAVLDFFIEGIAGAVTAKLKGYPANVSNPTTFVGFSVTGLGRGSRDPWDMTARIAALTDTTKIVRMKY